MLQQSLSVKTVKCLLISKHWTVTENKSKYFKISNDRLYISRYHLLLHLHSGVVGQSVWDFNHIKSINDVLLTTVSAMAYNVSYIKKQN